MAIQTRPRLGVAVVVTSVANAYKDMRYVVEMDEQEGFCDSALNAVVLQIFHDAVEDGKSVQTLRKHARV